MIEVLYDRSFIRLLDLNLLRLLNKNFYQDLKRLQTLLDNEYCMGLCYTQLTNVEQEQNGLYTYDRKAKFSPDEIYPVFSRKARIENNKKIRLNDTKKPSFLNFMRCRKVYLY